MFECLSVSLHFFLFTNFIIDVAYESTDVYGWSSHVTLSYKTQDGFLLDVTKSVDSELSPLKVPQPLELDSLVC